jgi:Rnl2 family RNA ligase
MSESFKKYLSIENDYKEKYINSLIRNGFMGPRVQWILTEKIHGANFSAICDGNTITWARRSGIIDKDEKFYNCDRVTREYTSSIFQIFKEVKKYFIIPIEHIQVYGELFGGIYPHKDIHEIDDIVHPIQKSIFYHPDIKFMAFDIRINNDRFLNYELMFEIVNRTRIIPISIIKQGTFDELIKVSPVFESKIGPYFGLPKIVDNFAEGYVLRTLTEHTRADGKRAMIKMKNPTYGDRKIHPKYSNPDIEIDQHARDRILMYNTTARIMGVISKLREVDRTNRLKIIGLTIQDIINDYEKTEEVSISKIERKKYISLLSNEVRIVYDQI